MKLTTLLALAAGANASSLFVGDYSEFERDHPEFRSCARQVPATCGSQKLKPSCCYESPGGMFLLTQFWDYSPAAGPAENFTLHGLWPDNCDGTWEQFCVPDLYVNGSDIPDIVQNQFNDSALLTKMNTYWKNNAGSDESFWEHEFNKHGTCIKTNRPACYRDQHYKKNLNVYNYIRAAVETYERYPTFDFLKGAGIVPSTTQNYTYDQIANALSSNFDGKSVYFSCDKNNALTEVWYYHYLQGPMILGTLHKVNTTTKPHCPATGIKFLPKNY